MNQDLAIRPWPYSSSTRSNSSRTPAFDPRTKEPFLPKAKRRWDGRCATWEEPPDQVLNGILWVLRTGAAWADLPEAYRFRPATGAFSHERSGTTRAGSIPSLAKDLLSAFPISIFGWVASADP